MRPVHLWMRLVLLLLLLMMMMSTTVRGTVHDPKQMRVQEDTSDDPASTVDPSLRLTPYAEDSSGTLLRVLTRLDRQMESIEKRMDALRSAFVRAQSDFREELLTLLDEIQSLKNAVAEVGTAVHTSGDTLDRVLEWTSQADASFERLEKPSSASTLRRTAAAGGGAGGGASKRKKKNKALPHERAAESVGSSHPLTFSDDIVDQQRALLSYPRGDATPREACTTNVTKQISVEMNRVWKQLKGTCSPKASSCWDVQKVGATKSGVYAINPTMAGFDGYVRVFCDLQTDGGGWTVIQRRNDYGMLKENFTRTWSEYRLGFGDVQREFWLGNDVVYALSNQEPVILRVELQDFENERRVAVYSHFRLESEKDYFRLQLGEYGGDAADSLSRSRGMIFSTADVDNDTWTGNCAKRFKGGWWFNNCHDANLNGLNHGGKHDSYANGINWYHWKGFHYSLKWTEMKIRPIGFAEDGPRQLPTPT